MDHSIIIINRLDQECCNCNRWASNVKKMSRTTICSSLVYSNLCRFVCINDCTVGRRPLTTEDSTMSQYETIPYDALPMAKIPSHVAASTQKRDTYESIDKNYLTEANRMNPVNSINDPAYDDCTDDADYEEPKNDISPTASCVEITEETNQYTGLSDRENAYLNLYADLN